jgi:hypothetical protein
MLLQFFVLPLRPEHSLTLERLLEIGLMLFEENLTECDTDTRIIHVDDNSPVVPMRESSPRLRPVSRQNNACANARPEQRSKSRLAAILTN